MNWPFVSRDRYQELATGRQLLQDRLRRSEMERDALRLALDEALVDSRKSREMVCDWLAEQQFGKPIYGSPAPALPADPTRDAAFESIQRRGQTGREIARDQTRQFFDEWRQRAGTATP